MLCAVQQITIGNRNGFHASLRGLVESICAISWLIEKADRTPSMMAIRPPSVGKILSAGYRRHAFLRDLYATLSGFTHPARLSHIYGWRIDPAEIKEKGPVSPFDLQMPAGFVDGWAAGLISIGRLGIFELNNLLSQHPEVLNMGRVMLNAEKEAV